MFRNLLTTLLILLSVLSCTKDKEFENQSFPVLHTSSVTNISPDGARLNGEILNIGQEKILRYGFMFSPETPDINNSDTVIIAKKADKGSFSINLDDAFAKNLRYNVRTFAITTNRVIYGNIVTFKSLGSKWNPWIYYNSVYVDDWSLFSASDNENAFLITAYGFTYFFNYVANSLSACASVPDDDPNGISEHDYVCFCLNNHLYTFSAGENKFFRYDMIQNFWKNLGTTPLALNKRKRGVVLNDTAYIISSGCLYAYDEVNNNWIKKTGLQMTNIMYLNLVADHNLYVFTNNQEIWKYTPASDSWQKETVYPGIWKNDITGFSIKSKLYYGLSFKGYEDGIPARDFWQYDIETGSWKRITNFPLVHTQNGIVNFSNGESGFFGYFDYELYRLILYKFDPNKVRP